METDNEVEVWHAMRATYRRELDAVHLLEKENLGCFVPMQYKVSIRKGKKVRTLVPVIRNLVLSMHVLPTYSVLSLKLLICNILLIPVAVRK